MNQFSIFESLCSNCNKVECICFSPTSTSEQPSNHQELLLPLYENIVADASITCNSISESSVFETQNLRNISNDSNRTTLKEPLIVNHEELNSNTFNLSSRGINIGHLNIQGICGEKLSKFSELKVLLTLPENDNLHIFGLSETKLKDHKATDVFKIKGFQTPFRKDNVSNGGGGLNCICQKWY